MLIVYLVVLGIWLFCGALFTGVWTIEDGVDEVSIMLARATALGFIWPLALIAVFLWGIAVITLMAFGDKRPNDTIKGWFVKGGSKKTRADDPDYWDPRY